MTATTSGSSGDCKMQKWTENDQGEVQMPFAGDMSFCHLVDLRQYTTDATRRTDEMALARYGRETWHIIRDLAYLVAFGD